jgi:hypothetical protein
MNTQFFVNHKTRLCQALGGIGPDHEANIASALKDGFVEVSPAELDVFRAETQRARDAGWIPGGRVSYAKFIERRRQ